jgi:hypothetical protein
VSEAVYPPPSAEWAEEIGVGILIGVGLTCCVLRCVLGPCSGIGKGLRGFGLLNVLRRGSRADVQRAAHVEDESYNRVIAWSQTWIDKSLLNGSIWSACFYRADSFCG